MSGIVGSASSPTSSGAGHARRPVAAQRSLRRRLCHRRLPTAVLGLDHRAFRRANIHCLGPRCAWWDLLVFHRRERAPHCVEASFPSIPLHCQGLGLLLVPQPLHPLRALREQELEEAAATGEHASEDLRRATAGLRRCGLAAALQPPVLQLLRTLLALGFRLLAPLAVLRSGASRRSIVPQWASASSASTLAQVVVLAASTQLCGCFGPHRFHNADLGKVDPLRLPVACEPTEERNVVLRLLLRRPGQRLNEGSNNNNGKSSPCECMSG